MLGDQWRVEDPFRHPLTLSRRSCDVADRAAPRIQRWKRLKLNRSNQSRDYGSQRFSEREELENAFLQLRHEDVYAGINVTQQERLQKTSNLTAAKSDTSHVTHYPPPTPRIRPQDSSSLTLLGPDDILGKIGESPAIATNDIPRLYPYSPLVHDDEIRLVRLLPSDEFSPVELRLVHSRLHEMPCYSALSYVWGSQRDSCEVLCDESGSVMYVTSNCYSALRRLRHPTENRILWIDAICIHQGNPMERNHQVRQMRQIYTAAESVVVYLSEDGEDAEKLLEGTKSHLGFLSMWDYFTNFFRLPYFSRIWMIQEICFARQVEIYYGDSLFDETFLRAIVTNPFHHAETLSKIPLAISIRYIDHSDRTLWRLLSLTKRHQATERRDKVIALLGVATDVDDEVKGFLADYMRDEVDVWQYTLMYFFLTAVGFLVPARTDLGPKMANPDYNWENALGNSESNFPKDQNASVIKLHRAYRCRVNLERSNASTGLDSISQTGVLEERIAQIGSVTAVKLLESLWTALHIILDPSSEAGPFASVSRTQCS